MPLKNKYRLCWSREAYNQLEFFFRKKGDKEGDCFIDAVTEQHDVNSYTTLFGIKMKSFTDLMDIDQIHKFVSDSRQIGGLRGRNVWDVLGIQVEDRDNIIIHFNDGPIEVRG